MRCLFAVVVCVCVTGRARAQPACPAGNLLAGRSPAAVTGVSDVSRVTDGAAAAEGALWNSVAAAVFATDTAAVTYDLGQAVPLEAVLVQADANDRYTILGAASAADRFAPLGEISSVVESAGHGLRMRTITPGRARVRFLRVEAGGGDGFYSLSELQAFCQRPTPYPPPLPIVATPIQTTPFSIFDVWNDETSARFELGLAVVGFAFLLWARRPSRLRRTRVVALVALGVISFAVYFNFGFFHFGNYIHMHEHCHYFVGSKYFRELSYDRLYECIATADAEDGLRAAVKRRPLRNLRTNVIEPSAGVLARPESCKQHFSTERWNAFKRDVAFFRARMSSDSWERFQIDHGYNATPVWNIAGTLLSNTGPATYARVLLFSLLDPALLVTAAGMVWWAFGWRVLCVSLLVFATNFPSRFYWTGGAFLRWDWIAALMAGLCLLRRDRPLWAGIFLGCATLLRGFPGVVFFGPLFVALHELWKTRSWPAVVHAPAARVLLGGALSAALLMPLGAAVAGGPRAYVDFAHNTHKHTSTPVTNGMGLKTVLTWRPSQVGRRVVNNALPDPWQPWKDARHRAWRRSWPLYVLLLSAYLCAVARASTRLPLWAAAALSVTLCAFAVEMTSYYYAFIWAVALLHAVRPQVGPLLLACTAYTQFVAWAPIGAYEWTKTRWLRMSTWFDEQHTLYSLATLLAFVAIVWVASRAGEPPPVATPDVGERRRVR